MAKYWIPLKLNNTCTNIIIASANSMESKAAVGLKILITTKTTTDDHMNHSNNIPIFHWNQILPSSNYNINPPAACFLKSCFLCHRHLSPNKDVYMYRGDQGFCSEECRSRQIYIDDVTQLEISTKKSIQNFRQQTHRRCDHDRSLHHRHHKSRRPVFLN